MPCWPFRDDRGVTEKITSQKIDSQGQLLWGENGISVSADGGFLANPKVIGTSDSFAVITWTEGPVVKAQKINQDGIKLWGDGVTVSDPNSTYINSDTQASDQGTVIVSMVESISFPSPKHLYAQKLAASDGSALWGSDPLPIFDLANGSLQFGNFPKFISDGMGGAVSLGSPHHPHSAQECKGLMPQAIKCSPLMALKHLPIYHNYGITNQFLQSIYPRHIYLLD